MSLLINLQAKKQILAEYTYCYYNCNNSGEGSMIELKVRKFGNSFGVILPKEVVSRLETGEGKKLFLIEGTDGEYRLSPYDPDFEKQMEKIEDIMSRYRNTLRALAK